MARAGTAVHASSRKHSHARCRERADLVFAVTGGTQHFDGIVDEATGLLKRFSTEKFERARATLAQAQSAVTDGAKQYANITDEYVHANPWPAMGVAAVAGALVGILTRR